MILLEKVKKNLILEHDGDDELLSGFISAALNYAESYQHIEAETYSKEDAGIPPATEQAVIMLARPFMKPAVEQSENQVHEAMQRIFDNEVEKL